MKYIDFLTNLKTEIKDANKGIGKTTASIQSYCYAINGVFRSIEDKMDSIINDDSYKISDIHIGAENKKIFESVISDLLDKEIVMHKEDYFLMKYPESVEAEAIKRDRSMMQTTRTIREMMSGKNMVMVDKKKFRSYVNKFKKISEDMQNTENDTGNADNDRPSVINKENDYDLNSLELKTLKEITTVTYKDIRIIVSASTNNIIKLLQIFKRKNSKTLDVQAVFLDLYGSSKSKHRTVKSVESMWGILKQTKIRKARYIKPIKYKISFGFPEKSTIKLLLKKVK